MKINTFTIITFGLLTLSIVSLWIPKRMFPKIVGGARLWTILFVLSLIFGLGTKIIHPSALISVTILYISCNLFGSKRYSFSVRIGTAIIISFISFGLIAHAIPGFSNPKIISNLLIAKGDNTYSLYLNFDKALVGLFILAFCHQKLSNIKCWVDMLKAIILPEAILILLIGTIALATGYVRFQIKLPEIFPVWAWVNLFFVCIAEESLFRGFLQKHLVGKLQEKKYGISIAIFLASLIFGLSHYKGGIDLIILATISGIGYGWIYHRTKAIESSILSHFLLNTIHLIFFTYPALAK